MRAEYQVLILSYVKSEAVKYLVLEREDQRIWQFASGGGEGNETPLISARRELFEETGVNSDNLVKLDAMTSIPAFYFREHREKEDLYVVPEYAFAVELENEDIRLSYEHSSFKFLTYEECKDILKFDSNRTALYELNTKITRGIL